MPRRSVLKDRDKGSAQVSLLPDMDHDFPRADCGFKHTIKHSCDRKNTDRCNQHRLDLVAGLTTHEQNHVIGVGLVKAIEPGLQPASDSKSDTAYLSGLHGT